MATKLLRAMCSTEEAVFQRYAAATNLSTHCHLAGQASHALHQHPWQYLRALNLGEAFTSVKLRTKPADLRKVVNCQIRFTNPL